ncbi:M28 family metallopeptidase [Methanolobus sp. ZRKC3]|uniref:M28 family metallopeptidase n=1 Tax=Methanolobus sp. ZRKC3 TaxID=3125786 RepID=UPI003255CE3D
MTFLNREEIDEQIDSIIIERPLGSSGNESVLSYLKNKISRMRYDIEVLPFECNYWEKSTSFLEIEDEKFKIEPCPFSRPYEGEGEIVVIEEPDALKEGNLKGKILLLKGNIAKEPLMPKDFPFYYPKEHERIIEGLLKTEACAIIAATGKHPMSGLDPFPLLEDGNFSIPVAYTNEFVGNMILEKHDKAYLCISSSVQKVKSEQIIASRKGRRDDCGKIIICAHMDTKYGTPGALDNASGVMMMLKIMQNIREQETDFDIEFVPFNGEEYYEVKGQTEYLDHISKENKPIKLVINIDSPGHKKSNSALSLYNFSEKMKSDIDARVSKNKKIEIGQKWYAGDHAMFAFQGIPCIAVTSSNLFESVLELTHTENDIIENLDFDLINITADFLTEIIDMTN